MCLTISQVLSSKSNPFIKYGISSKSVTLLMGRIIPYLCNVIIPIINHWECKYI